MTFEPLHDWVLLKFEEREQQTAGGIIISETAKQDNQRGVVLAVGPERFVNGKNLDMSVSPGDRVLFSSYAAMELEINGEKFGLLRDRDVIGRFAD